jgi:hypothetical protein
MSLHREVLWMYLLRNLIWHIYKADCELHFHLGKYKFCFRSGFSIRTISVYNLASLRITNYYKVAFQRILTKLPCSLTVFRSRCKKSMYLQIGLNTEVELLHPVTFRTYTEVSIFRSCIISVDFTSMWRHVIINNCCLIYKVSGTLTCSISYRGWSMYDLYVISCFQ